MHLGKLLVASASAHGHVAQHFGMLMRERLPLQHGGKRGNALRLETR